MHLSAGLPRDLLDNGKRLSVKGLRTELGQLTVRVENRDGQIRYSVQLDHPERRELSIVLHLRIPDRTWAIPLVLENGRAKGTVAIE